MNKAAYLPRTLPVVSRQLLNTYTTPPPVSLNDEGAKVISTLDTP